MRFVKPLFGLVVVACIGVMTIQPALAQNNQPPQMSTGLMAFTTCSGVDYREIVANALGMTVLDLRTALAGGKSLQDIAASKNVSLDTVTAALETARKAAIAQAIKDGILTQEEADQMQSMGNPPQNGIAPGGNPPDQGQNGGKSGQAPNENPPDQGQNGGQPGQAPNGQPGGAMPNMDRVAMQYGISALNSPRLIPLTASTLNMKCPDLVKALSTGQNQTIAAVAKIQNVDVNELIATLVKAYQAAQADNLQNGIVTQAQIDAAKVDATKLMTDFVNSANSLTQMRMGRGGQPGGQPPANASK